MDFLWKIFLEGIPWLWKGLIFWMKANKITWDDGLADTAERVGEIFVFGKPNADGSGWDIPPVTDSAKKGEIVRSVTCAMLRKVFKDQEFQQMAKLTEVQAGIVFAAAVTKINPQAVDTQEEIEAILADFKSL